MVAEALELALERDHAPLEALGVEVAVLEGVGDPTSKPLGDEAFQAQCLTMPLQTLEFVVMPSSSEPVGAPELARSLKLPGTRLRQLIRDHKLVPSHRRYSRYELGSADVARITRHPAVQRAMASARASRDRA